METTTKPGVGTFNTHCVAGVDHERILAARVFDHLANLAWPVVKSFRGDLFHDACWLLDNLGENASDMTPFEFVYGVRESGTSIGTSEELVSLSNNRLVYRVTVFIADSSRWHVTIA